MSGTVEGGTRRVRRSVRRACLGAVLAAGVVAVPALAADAPGRPVRSMVRHPDWSVKANIYEVNIRQYTPEGTFRAFERHLPRLRRMGVDILWIMPINPISEKNRKGPLGSYYAVRDYKAVNPEFGDLEDFRRLVKQAHALGMKVIIDWVANHTGWDNVWISQHPDWFQRDAKGEIGPFSYVDPNDHHVEVWADVVGLDYRQPALWDGMIDAMRYWVKTADIDGFRCDVAPRVPTPFWERARRELEQIKPVFMLAEGDEPGEQVRAFDMSYDWGLYQLMVKVAHGKAPVRALGDYYRTPPRTFPVGAYRMTLTSDHDENSWNGTDRELYGDAARPMAVLAATLPGMPLIYSGQESGLDKRLEFFRRDPIDWRTYDRADFYAALLKLKHETPALWNGTAGGDLRVVELGSDKVFAFIRTRGRSRVRVLVNLSAAPQAVSGAGFRAETIEPWGYRIQR